MRWGDCRSTKDQDSEVGCSKSHLFTPSVESSLTICSQQRTNNAVVVIVGLESAQDRSISGSACVLERHHNRGCIHGCNLTIFPTHLIVIHQSSLTSRKIKSLSMSGPLMGTTRQYVRHLEKKKRATRKRPVRKGQKYDASSEFGGDGGFFNSSTTEDESINGSS